MITLKLKLKETINITKFQTQWNSVLRFCFQQLKKDLPRPIVEKLTKNLNNIELLDATWIRNASMKAVEMLSAGNQEVIFGSKRNFWQRKYKKITNEEFQVKRLLPIYAIGSKMDKCGNRKFKLKIIEDDKIIFCVNKNTHIEMIPIVDKKRKKILETLQQKSENHEIPLTYSLDNNYVYITYDENIFKQKREKTKIKNNRILSLDLNPNYIGLTIADWSDNTKCNKTIIHKEVISNKKINDLKQSPYQTNKRNFESYEIAKYIVDLARHYNVETIGVEKLDMSPKNHLKGKRYNRLLNNSWNRTKFYNNLNKRCNLFDIKLLEIVPQYSSFIGQMKNEDEPEMIAAAIEMGRRTYLFSNIYVKKQVWNKFKADIVFPKFDIMELPTRWKEMAKLNSVDDWKGLYRLIKNSKSSYRVPLTACKSWDGFRFKSNVSKVARYLETKVNT